MSSEQSCQSACSLSALILMLELVLPLLIQEIGISHGQTPSADSSVTPGSQISLRGTPPQAIDLVTDSKFTAVLNHKMFHLLLKDQ